MRKKQSYIRHPVKNIDLRMYIAEHGISFGQIAEHIHYSQSRFSQILNSDMPDWRRKEILQAVLEIRMERGDFEHVKKGVICDSMGRSMGNNVDDASVKAVRG